MKHKIAIKLMIFIVVLACAGPFLIRDKEGKPLLSIDDIEWPHISLPKISLFSKTSAPKIASNDPVKTEILSPATTNPVPGQDVVVIYRFKDNDGIYHYSNIKPNFENYEVLYVPVNGENEKRTLTQIKEKIASWVQKFKSAEKSPENSQSTSNTSDFSVKDVYSNPKKAIDAAKELKEKLENDFKSRDNMMQSLDH